jgi:hypothetical protein
MKREPILPEHWLEADDSEGDDQFRDGRPPGQFTLGQNDRAETAHLARRRDAENKRDVIELL